MTFFPITKKSYRGRTIAFITSLFFLSALAIPVFIGVKTPLTPAAPPAWHQVHVGMQRSDILALAGPAQKGMYPEKILETWVRDGFLGICKLNSWYENHADEPATWVYDY